MWTKFVQARLLRCKPQQKELGDRCGGVLGPFWTHMGLSLGSFGRSLGAVGALLGASWGALGSLWGAPGGS